MSAHQEKMTVEAQMKVTDRRHEISRGFSRDKIEEKINANLEAIYAQISALPETMDRFI